MHQKRLRKRNTHTLKSVHGKWNVNWTLRSFSMQIRMSACLRSENKYYLNACFFFSLFLCSNRKYIQLHDCITITEFKAIFHKCNVEQVARLTSTLAIDTLWYIGAIFFYSGKFFSSVYIVVAVFLVLFVCFLDFRVVRLSIACLFRSMHCDK